MNNKNKDLSTAVVVLSAIALGLQLFGIMAFWLLLSMTLFVSAFGEMFFGLVGFLVVCVIASIILHILALVFAVKGAKQNSRGYILTSSILNAVCILVGDIVSVAAAVCGFILCYKMDEEKTEDGQNENIDGGLNICKDNIYGMK